MLSLQSSPCLTVYVQESTPKSVKSPASEKKREKEKEKKSLAIRTQDNQKQRIENYWTQQSLPYSAAFSAKNKPSCPQFLWTEPK